MFGEALVLEDVAIGGSGSALGDSVSTSGTASSSSCVGAADGVPTSGATNGLVATSSL